MDELRSEKTGFQRAVTGLRMKLPIIVVGSDDDRINTPDKARAIINITSDKMIIHIPYETRDGKDIRENTERIVMKYLVDKSADVEEKEAKGDIRTKLVVSDIDDSKFL